MTERRHGERGSGRCTTSSIGLMGGGRRGSTPGTRWAFNGQTGAGSPVTSKTPQRARCQDVLFESGTSWGGDTPSVGFNLGLLLGLLPDWAPSPDISPLSRKPSGDTGIVVPAPRRGHVSRGRGRLFPPIAVRHGDGQPRLIKGERIPKRPNQSRRFLTDTFNSRLARQLGDAGRG